MALFPRIREQRPLLFGSSASFVINSVGSLTVGNPIRLVIPRQPRRLERLSVHINATIAAPTSTASYNALEGLIKEARLIVSDSAGQNRTMIKAGGPTLLSWHRRNVGQLGRFTQASFGSKTAATYDLFIPIHLRHPALSEIIGHRTSLPLDSAFIAADPILELDFGTWADCGLSAGNITINSAKVNLIYREVPSSIQYIPTEFISNDITWPSGGGKGTYDLPSNGYLGGALLENFTSATARGDALASTGSWKFRYGRSEVLDLYEKLIQEEDGWWIGDYPNDVAAVSVKNDLSQFYVDFLHDTPLGEAVSGGSMPNLYSDNSGDRIQLEGTNLNASALSKVSLYKFLDKNTAGLIGG
ncbi:MAG: hypothetical protein DVB31_05410 [Verrucomicrobia bacterium]|nr:MAG: hypothetical protein DVB31_05410 [Verrucomicrobiota bacterium]